MGKWALIPLAPDKYLVDGEKCLGLSVDEALTAGYTGFDLFL